MCLLLIGFDSHPDYRLIIAANRDEFYRRPTAPAAFWSDVPKVLAGRDLKEGGSWLGLDVQGRFAAVTNFRQGQRERSAPRSRGRLVSDFLSDGITASEYMRRVQRDAALYNGFNLLAGGLEEVFYYSNRENRIRALSPGVYGLSNHLLDTPWPKLTTSKSAFQTLLQRPGTDPTAGLFDLLASRSQFSDEVLPSTGVGPEWERLLSSAFILSNEYGTRSSTVILVDRNDQIVFEERSFGPGAVPAGETRFELELGSGAARPVD